MNFKHVSAGLAVLTILGLIFAGAPLVQAATNAQAAKCADTYTVAAGDTLSLIAQKTLGDLKAYTQIVDATNAAAKVDTSFKTIADPNIIEVGQKPVSARQKPAWRYQFHRNGDACSCDGSQHRRRCGRTIHADRSGGGCERACVPAHT